MMQPTRRPFAALALAGLVAAQAPAAAQESIEFIARLLPGRTQVVESATEAVTTLRVIEDRGIVAKSNGRLSGAPTTMTIVREQAFRTATEAAGADGSFAVEMRFLSQSTSLRGADGRLQPMPERATLAGTAIRATVEADGRLRPDTVRIEGPDAALADQLRPALMAALTQAAQLPALTLQRGRSVPQDLSMQLPLPGIATLDMALRITHQLLGVEDGVARIQQVFTLGLGSAPAGMKMSAEGSGGGSLRYDTRSRTVLDSENGTLTTVTIDAPDGVLELRMNAKQTQRLRPPG